MMCDFGVDAQRQLQGIEQQQEGKKRRSWPEDVVENDENDDVVSSLAPGLLRRLYNRFTYSYMNQILDDGEERKRRRKQLEDDKKKKTQGMKGGDEDIVNEDEVFASAHLTYDDLFAVPRSMKSKDLSNQFKDFYDSRAKFHEESVESSSKDMKFLVLGVLWALAKRTFVPAGYYQLLTVFCQVTVPLLVRRLLEILEERPGEDITRYGLPYALAIFVTLLINALGNNRYRFLAMRTGITIRAAVVTVLYERVLRLTPVGKMNFTSGQMNNMIAVDTQKLYEVTQEGHLVWSLPLTTVLVTGMLWTIIGPTSTMVGVFSLVMMVPIVERITSAMLKLRERRVSQSDRRIQTVNAMLQGIKITKLNNYEENYHRRIELDIRRMEMRYLRQELSIWAVTLVVMVSSPVLATAATFVTYVYINPRDEDGGGHILTAARTFSVLLFFSALRFPINYAGRLMGKAVQAWSAMDRISKFMEREVREQPTVQHKEDPPNSDKASSPQLQPALLLQNAAFCVGGNSELPAEADKRKQGRDKRTRSGFLACCGKDAATAAVVTDDNDVSGEQKGSDGKATAMVSPSSSHFKIAASDFQVGKGQVLAIAGPVGSGKSTLVDGIIDEVPKIPVSTSSSSPVIVSTRGTVAHVPQTPFILNATLRDNILFGRPMDRELYERVLYVCCLRLDIEQLGVDGDLTEIGERGVTLSGGQKQRVSLARAAYAKPDLVLLDDPLSALDAGTAKLVFERLIKSSSATPPDPSSSSSPNKNNTAFFADAAVVLVTHAAHFVKRVDQVMVIVDGRSQFVGTWDELVNFDGKAAHGDDNYDAEKTTSAIDFIRTSIQEEEEKAGDGKVGSNDNADESLGEENSSTAIDKKGDKIKGRALMTVEEREHGVSSMGTWLLWFRRAGGISFFFIQVLFMSVDRFTYVAVEYWLARWTDAAEPGQTISMFGIEFPSQTDGRSAQSKYVLVYAVLIVVSPFCTFLRSEWAVTGGARAAGHVFSAMLSSVLRAPMSFFETTPMGRVLNRFTYDTEVVDVTLTQQMSLFIISCSWFITGVVLKCTILPWMILAIVPVTLAYWFMLLHYRVSATDLQRLDALSRSPVQAMVSEGLDGSTAIRIFRQEASFINKFQKNVDINSSALLNFITAQRWLGIRIETLGALVVLVSCVLVTTLNHKSRLDAGLVGLLVIWSGNFTITLGFLVDTFGEAEAAITAIERVDAMAYLPSERAMKTRDDERPSPSWPHAGQLNFDRVCLRYREGLPLALDNLTFTIPAGKRCGVVGRTGAGKSSLAVALFRLVEIESGTIFLDGVDLASLGLSDVRGRTNGMSIIPQDPFLAGRTISECLDPFEQRSQMEIVEALEAVRLGSYTPDTVVEEGGSNFSVGERQLLNLARQLLSKPRVLVLDESTASIDGETDLFIQDMLRTRFRDTTLVTVAHRLNTIMDYDLILVMDSGRAVEMGPPSELLERNGMFTELVDATGREGAKALRAMVRS